MSLHTSAVTGTLGDERRCAACDDPLDDADHDCPHGGLTAVCATCCPRCLGP